MVRTFFRVFMGQTVLLCFLWAGAIVGPDVLARVAEGGQARPARPPASGVPVADPEVFPAQDNTVSPPSPPLPLSQKQKKELLKSNVKKMKKDADELVDLAKSLQGDVNDSNENVLSLKVVDKAEKIEKLARRIRNAARGQ